jgi:hypothetical protein
LRAKARDLRSLPDPGLPICPPPQNFASLALI